MSETWHGSKWLKDMPDELLTPMVIHPTSERHFFVEELCCCKDGTYFIPTRWFTKKNNGLWAWGYGVEKAEVLFKYLKQTIHLIPLSKNQAGFLVREDTKIQWPLTEMHEDYLSLFSSGNEAHFTGN
jgi:hypothetical protein